MEKIGICFELFFKNSLYEAKAVNFPIVARAKNFEELQKNIEQAIQNHFTNKEVTYYVFFNGHTICRNKHG